MRPRDPDERRETVRRYRRRKKLGLPSPRDTDEKASYLPTPEEIAEACREIRESKQEEEPQPKPLALDKVYKRPRF